MIIPGNVATIECDKCATRTGERNTQDWCAFSVTNSKYDKGRGMDVKYHASFHLCPTCKVAVISWMGDGFN